jgi:hypothetical protein
MFSLPILIAGFIYMCVKPKNSKAIFILSLILLLILISYFIILIICSLNEDNTTYEIMNYANYIKNYLQGALILGILIISIRKKNRQTHKQPII